MPVTAKILSQNRAITLIALIFLLPISGCAVSVSVGKPKPKPQATTQAAPALLARTSIAIPTNAELLAQGSDPLHYTATEPGTIYVFSRDERQVSLQYDLQTGETFMLAPSASGAAFTADRHLGQPGSGTVPASAGGYEIYFLSKQPAATSPATAPTEGQPVPLVPAPTTVPVP